MTDKIIIDANDKIGDCLVGIGNKIDAGDEWYSLPFWFKKIGDGKFELWSSNQLPDYLNDIIETSPLNTKNNDK